MLYPLLKVDSTPAHIHAKTGSDSHSHFFPEDLEAYVDLEETESLFSNFRDYYTDTCAAYMGSRVSTDDVFTSCTDIQSTAAC